MTEKQKSIGFALEGITIEQFAIIEASFKKGEKVALGADVKFGLNDENKVISTFFNVSFLQNGTPFLILAIECYFNVEENAWDSFFGNENNMLTIPQGFASHMAMLTVGTARGILYAKTEKTYFKKFLLPTLNVNELIKQDVVFES